MNRQNMKTIETRINGVPVERLAATVEAVKTEPSLGKFRFRVKNRWITGGHNRSTIRSFYGAGQEHETRQKEFVFDNGEPEVLLGNDEGANPVEFVLHALAGCMTTTMAYHAAARGIRVEEIESELEGNLDAQGLLQTNPDVRSGYQNIRVKFRVKSDAPAELLEELAKASPVFDTISNPVNVQVSVDRK